MPALSIHHLPRRIRAGSSVRRLTYRGAGIATGGMLFVAALLALPGVIAPAFAAGSTGAPSALHVTVSAGNSGSLILSATDSDGAAPTQPVHFFVTTSLFGGAKLVPIGVAHSYGGFALSYKPTVTGRQTFTAEILDSSGAVLSSGTSSFLVTTRTAMFSPSETNAPKPLASFGRGMVGVLLAIVGLIWLTLIVTLVRVTRGTARLAT